jgi:hypothetical protein
VFKRETTGSGSGSLSSPCSSVSVNPIGIEASSFADLPIVSIVVPDDGSVTQLEGDITNTVIDITIRLNKGTPVEYVLG